jgi:branched-subunit amino acid ABC-type transport system permease component
MSFSGWLELIASGLITGGIYALVALGLNLQYGLMRILNIAHGEFLMLGAFVTLSCTKASIPFFFAILIATVALGLFGLLVERVLIQWLYGRIEMTMLATFGLSLILVQVAVLIWGTATQGLSTPLGSFHIGRYSESEYRVALIFAALAMLVVVWLAFTRTRFGVMARAATQLPEMAAAVGVDTRLIRAGTFMFGSALAGLAGGLLAPIAAVAPSMGAAYVARAFMTVVVGGPGVITGTAAAAGILGSVERLVSDYATAFLGTTALLVIAIVLLRLMPTGISGRLRRSL